MASLNTDCCPLQISLGMIMARTEIAASTLRTSSLQVTVATMRGMQISQSTSTRLWPWETRTAWSGSARSPEAGGAGAPGRRKTKTSFCCRYGRWVQEKTLGAAVVRGRRTAAFPGREGHLSLAHAACLMLGCPSGSANRQVVRGCGLRWPRAQRAARQQGSAPHNWEPAAGNGQEEVASLRRENAVQEHVCSGGDGASIAGCLAAPLLKPSLPGRRTICWRWRGR